MKRQCLIVACLCLSAARVFAAPTIDLDEWDLPSLVMTSKEVVHFAAPEPIFSGVVNAVWKSDGLQVAVLSSQLRVEAVKERVSLVIWDMKAQQAKILWSQELETTDSPEPTPTASLDLELGIQFGWYGQTVLACLPRWEILPDGKMKNWRELAQFFPTSGRKKVLKERLGEEILFVSPTGSSALLYTLKSEAQPGKIKVLGGEEVELPEGFRFGRFTQGTFAVHKQESDQAEAWQIFDTTSKKLIEVDCAPTEAQLSLKGDLRVVTMPDRLASGVEVTSLWLKFTGKPVKGEVNSALVAAAREVSVVGLSPRGNAFLYVADSTAYVVYLTRQSKEEFLEVLRREEAQSELVDQACDVGLALQAYAAANGGRLPLKDELEALLPGYFQEQANPDLKGFTFLQAGKVLADLKRNEVLGFYAADGGRAEVMANGVARWVAKDEIPSGNGDN